MVKKLMFVLTLMGFTYFSQAQSLELGVFGGGSYLINDLNPATHFSDVKPAFGIVGRYYSTSRWAFRTSVTTTTADLIDRLTDVSVVAEFNFFDYYTGSNKSYVSP